MADPTAAAAASGDPLGAPPPPPQSPPQLPPAGPLPPSAALPAAGNASTTPTAPNTTAPTDVNNLLKLFRQQLALQQQQTAQMVAVINGLSAQLAQGNNAPNIPGWPPTSTATPSPAYTSPSLAHTGPAAGGAIVSPNHASTGGATGIVAGIRPLLPNTAIPPPGAPVPAGGHAQVHFTPPFTQQIGHTQRMPMPSSSIVGGAIPSGGGQAAPPGVGLVSGGHNTAATDADTEDDVGSTSGFFGSRGRSRIRRGGPARSSRSIRSRSPSTDIDDPSDGYAVNRENKEMTCKSISIKPFSISNKDQDFPIWVQ